MHQQVVQCFLSFVFGLPEIKFLPSGTKSQWRSPYQPRSPLARLFELQNRRPYEKPDGALSDRPSSKGGLLHQSPHEGAGTCRSTFSEHEIGRVIVGHVEEPVSTYSHRDSIYRNSKTERTLNTPIGRKTLATSHFRSRKKTSDCRHHLVKLECLCEHPRHNLRS